MRIGVISQKFSDYGNKRLLEEIQKKDALVKIFSHHAIMTMDKSPDLFIKSKKLEHADVVLARFTNRHLNFGLMLVKHMQLMGIPVINSAEGIRNCKNKYLTTLRLKRKKVPMPKSAIALAAKDMLRYIRKQKGPVVVKLVISSHGIGIGKIKDEEDAHEWLDTFQHFHQPIYIQEYIPHGGEDLRLFVVGDEVAGSMRRIAPKGSWKTNYSAGGSVEKYMPSKKLKDMAIKAAKACKVAVAGVDIIQSPDGPIVVEVNATPQFKGLEKATKKNIAKKIIDHAKKVAKR